MDNQHWGEMIGVLDEIAACYTRMTALAEQKRDALVNVKVNSINELISKEETIIKEVSVLETKRQKLVECIATNNCWTDEKIKLLDLVERAPLDYAARMKDVGQRLADIVMQIALLNGINNNLLKQAMSIVEFNINILSRAQATPFYDAGGGQPQGDKGNMGLSVFDRKA